MYRVYGRRHSYGMEEGTHIVWKKTLILFIWHMMGVVVLAAHNAVVVQCSDHSETVKTRPCLACFTGFTQVHRAGGRVYDDCYV